MNIDELTDIIINATADNYEACIRFLVKSLSLIQEFCPQVALSGIDVAHKYWIESSIDSAGLEDARVKCWKYLDAKSASNNTQEKAFCAIRAVICVLYAESPSQDNGELIDCFLQMVNVVMENNIEIIEYKIRSEIGNNH